MLRRHTAPPWRPRSRPCRSRGLEDQCRGQPAARADTLGSPLAGRFHRDHGQVDPRTHRTRYRADRRTCRARARDHWPRNRRDSPRALRGAQDVCARRARRRPPAPIRTMQLASPRPSPGPRGSRRSSTPSPWKPVSSVSTFPSSSRRHVVMYSLSSHKGPKVVALIEAGRETSPKPGLQSDREAVRQVQSYLRRPSEGRRLPEHHRQMRRPLRARCVHI